MSRSPRRSIPEFWRALSLTLSRLQTAAADSLGLTPSDLKCLERLRTEGAVTPSTLCELTGHTAGAVTGMIDRLQAAGFAERARDKTDGRRVVVKPNRRAIGKHLGPLQRTLDSAFEEIGGEFSAAELQLVARYLERSIEVLDGVVGEVNTS